MPRQKSTCRPPRDPSDNDVSSPFLEKGRDPSEFEEEEDSVRSDEYDDFIGQRTNTTFASSSNNSSISVTSDDESGCNERRAARIDEAILLTSGDDRGRRGGGAHPELLRGYNNNNDNNNKNNHNTNTIGNGSTSGGGKGSRRGYSNNNNNKNNHDTHGDEYDEERSYRTSSKPSKRSNNKWYHRSKTSTATPSRRQASPFNNNSTRGPRYDDNDYNHRVKYRSASSTQRALEEMKRKKSEAREKKRALSVLALMIATAGGVHFTSRGGIGGRVGGGGIGGGGIGSGSGAVGINRATVIGESDAVDKVYGKIKSDNPGNGAAGAVVNEQSVKLLGSGESIASDTNHDNSNNDNAANPPSDVDLPAEEPPPQEKIYDESHQFLTPLHHFADVRDVPRRTDTAFFFHVPRSGGSTVKDMLGKCMRLIQASEVGVRDGHDADASLQILTVQENRYVNVDTTTIPGIQRAVDMGLAQSGLSDLIVSSYFRDGAALFDLEHQGRAFVMLRNPIDRAVSMYYHRLHELHDLEDSVTLEDYAQGNGIENNWMTRFLTDRMTGELTKEDLEQAKVILKEKFLIGFLDDLEESIYRIIKYNGWRYADDETDKMKQEDCIADLTKVGSNINAEGYEIPKRGTQGYALIIWQTQFDTKLYDYAKELFDGQTKLYGTKERKKQRKKDKQKKKGG